jgi:hypothetical protein
VWVGGPDHLMGWRGDPPPGCDWLPADWPADHFPLGPDPRQLRGWFDHAEFLLRDGSDLACGRGGIDDRVFGWRAALRAARQLARHYAPAAAPSGHPYPTVRTAGLAEFLSLRDAVLAVASAGTSGGRGKGKHIDAKMLKVMAENPESHGWSARQWADHLDCSDGTVKDTKTWKERLKAARSMAAADRMTRSERQPKGRRRK